MTITLAPFGELTDQKFLELCAQHRDLRLERTARGELVIMPPSGAESGHTNSKITHRLVAWAESNDLGVVFDSSAGFTLPNQAIRGPDAAWIERSRWEALSPEDRKGFAHICPDFVVELISPSDSLPETRQKMLEYRDNGTRLGWLLDPFRQLAEVYRPGQPAEILRNPESLSGEDVLAGFVLSLKGIFLK